MITNEKMTRLQVLVITICFVMNMCDGMNVMVISYATTAITKAWSVAPGRFGWIFSAGLLGMALGAMVLAPKADRIGRKRMILVSAAWMGAGALVTGFAQSPEALIGLRFFTGLGIGAMLACTSTLTAEYAPALSRSFWISVVMAGYPAGAILCGLAAHPLIEQFGWPSLFMVSGGFTLATIPFIALYVKESQEFLKKRAVAAASIRVVFDRQKATSTVILWLSFFLCFATLYFLTSWIPKLAANEGLSASLSILAGLFFNLGALLGIVTQGYLSQKLGLKKVICYFLIATALLMIAFGFIHQPVFVLLLFCCIGFGIQGGFIGLYAVAARLYETEVRSTGIGWAIGFGRLGAIAGPFFGGVLIGKGITTSLNFIFFAVPVVLAGVATLYIKYNE